MRKGFTLLETLVVMVIAGIVIMMAAPSVGSTVQQTQVQQAAATFGQDLQQAQMLAARQRQPVTLTIVTDSMIYRLRNRADNTVYLTRYLSGTGSEFAVKTLTTNATTATFFPNGLVVLGGGAAAPLTVDIRVGTKGRRVTMTSAGLVRTAGL